MKQILTIGGILLAGLATQAQAITIDYTELPDSFPNTIITPALDVGGVTVTGSGDVHVLKFNGLGIVGGFSDLTVSSGEFIDFAFAAPATDVSYFVPSAGESSLGGTIPTNGLAGERVLEAFAPGGASLGTADQNGIFTFAVTSLFGGGPIERFRLTLAGEAEFLFLGSISFETAVANPVPLPAAFPLFAVGLGLLGLLGRCRKHRH